MNKETIVKVVTINVIEKDIIEIKDEPSFEKIKEMISETTQPLIFDNGRAYYIIGDTVMYYWNYK